VAALASTLLAGPAMAAETFMAVTTFTMIADIARNVAGIIGLKWKDLLLHAFDPA
jgi:ABC-type Zn uptake system ZnuABC Zn-binding protein ZnuA